MYDIQIFRVIASCSKQPYDVSPFLLAYYGVRLFTTKEKYDAGGDTIFPAIFGDSINPSSVDVHRGDYIQTMGDRFRNLHLKTTNWQKQEPKTRPRILW